MRSVLVGPDPDRLRIVTADPGNTLPSEIGQSLGQSPESRLGQFRLEPTDITSYQVEGVTTSLAPRMSTPRELQVPEQWCPTLPAMCR